MIKYSIDSIDTEKAEAILNVMRRPNNRYCEPNALFGSLESNLLSLSMAELLGLILRLLREDISTTLQGLDDLRWVFVATRKSLRPDIEPHRDELCGYVRFLNPYVRADVPRSMWAQAAEDFKGLYEGQASQGTIPTPKVPGWTEFWDRHITGIDKALLQLRIIIDRNAPF